MTQPDSVADAPGTVNPANDELRTLLLSAKGGSREAAANLLERCRDYLLLVANAEVPSAIRPKVGASDLVQQSIAEGWRDFGQFEGGTEFELRGWLRNILLNNLRDTTRGYFQTAKRDATREIPLPDDDSVNGRSVPLAGNDPSPSTCASEGEELARVHAAIARLPEHYSRIIRLRNLEYLKFAEIAERMNIDKELARKLWERAVKRLARELKAQS